ncbi:MAG: hypothetical protein IJ673_11900 [Treponema sp.]|nr:hypothetical protein [Treponema sp.]
MLITSKERVWKDYIISYTDFGNPILSKNTPEWIKKAHYFYTHKKQDDFYALLKEHEIIDYD